MIECLGGYLVIPLVLRAANSNNSNNFYNVNTNGNWNNNNANNTYGIAPDFCNEAEPVKDSCLLTLYTAFKRKDWFFLGFFLKIIHDAFVRTLLAWFKVCLFL